MGGAVSAGASNDELIDNLVKAGYIKSALLERVFRSVDRGAYYKDGQRENAYHDIAWKYGNLHLSAPCIYSEVMEALQLGRGQSFLNLGSGTGYLSTMAGLIVGPYGINHGIEYYDDVVDYANEKWCEFKYSSPTLDGFDGYAEPEFFYGNCLNLDLGSLRTYDRVYCGAQVPTEYETYMKRLLNIGGILVMPFNDNLVQITRVGPSSWQTRNILPVSFADLIPPGRLDEPICLGLAQPMCLQSITRFAIRSLIRSKLNVNEQLTSSLSKRRRLSEKRDTVSKIARVIFPGDDDDDGDGFTVRVSFPFTSSRDNSHDPGENDTQSLTVRNVEEEGSIGEDSDFYDHPSSVDGETSDKENLDSDPSFQTRPSSRFGFEKDFKSIALTLSCEMQAAIQTLPLPTYLKIFVNYDRPLNNM